MRATINTNGHGRGVNGVGSLLPPSSIHGLGVLMGGGGSWMGNVGKS